MYLKKGGWVSFFFLQNFYICLQITTAYYWLMRTIFASKVRRLKEISYQSSTIHLSWPSLKHVYSISWVINSRLNMSRHSKNQGIGRLSPWKNKSNLFLYLLILRIHCHGNQIQWSDLSLCSQQNCHAKWKKY